MADVKALGVILNQTTACVWALSFFLVYGVDIPRLHRVLAGHDYLLYAAPLTIGYAAKSSSPELSYVYFQLMQPICAVAFTLAWFRTMRAWDHSELTRRYAQRGWLGRLLTSGFLISMVFVAMASFTLVGGQNLPGTSLNTSRFSLALFGPIAAGGLAVFLALYYGNALAKCIAASKKG